MSVKWLLSATSVGQLERSVRLGTRPQSKTFIPKQKLVMGEPLKRYVERKLTLIYLA